MEIGLFTITSDLHAEVIDKVLCDPFVAPLAAQFEFDVCGADFSRYGTHGLDLIYVRTGGTEGIFKHFYPQVEAAHKKVVLLTSGKSNSLAASMEILTWLRQRGVEGEIIHGDTEAVCERISELEKVAEGETCPLNPDAGGPVGEGWQFLGGLPDGLCAERTLRLGVVGHPSDWLISSDPDADALRTRLGIELVDIDMAELVGGVATACDPLPEESALPPVEGNLSRPDLRRISADSYETALKVYRALRKIVTAHSLDGVTVRCFDLLTSVHNTGCLALAILNSSGIPASCEGDIPTLVSMMIARKVLGLSAFQVNPSRIDTTSGECLFAHCTLPLDMVESFKYDTHFESGIGVAIKGELPLGSITIFKVSADLSRVFAVDAELVENLKEESLCRTQVVVRMDPAAAKVFLTDPVGNHHLIIRGHHASELSIFA